MDLNQFVAVAIESYKIIVAGLVVIAYLVMGYKFIRKEIDNANSPMHIIAFLACVCFWPTLVIIIPFVDLDFDWTIKPRKKK